MELDLLSALDRPALDPLTDFDADDCLGNSCSSVVDGPSEAVAIAGGLECEPGSVCGVAVVDSGEAALFFLRISSAAAMTFENLSPTDFFFFLPCSGSSSSSSVSPSSVSSSSVSSSSLLSSSSSSSSSLSSSSLSILLALPPEYSDTVSHF